jgi:chorismate dehydratase
VRSLLLVRRASQPLAALRFVAADIASRTTLAYARILFHNWGNPDVPFVPLPADLDAMLDQADAAILIGDPALLALEERANRFERTSEELVYHDLAWEWKSLTGLPFVSAVWGIACSSPWDECIAGAPGPSHLGTGDGTWESMNSLTEDFIQSRNHGLQNIDALVAEWSDKLPISEQIIRSYLTANIHYILDEECLEGMRVFFRTAADLGILPEYTLSIPEPVF